MKWRGPLEDGVTQSLLSKFLQCPYQFYIYAGLGLQEPSIPEPNLIWGDTFHKGLELSIEKPYRIEQFTPEDWEEIYRGVDEHIQRDWPTAPLTFPHSIKNMLPLYEDEYKLEHPNIHTEVKFKIPYTTASGNKVTLKGKADGIDAPTGEADLLVEHKCKGRIDIAQTYYEIPVDLQVTIYCRVLGPRKVIYDLIRIPDTQWSLPPRGNTQKPSNYINDLYHSKYWGDFPITVKKKLWLQQTTIILDNETVERTMAETVDPLIDRLCLYWEYVSDPNFDWQNPKHFNHLFYKTPIRFFDPARTMSYKSPYWNFLVGQIDLDALCPVESFYAELDDE